MHTDKIAVVGLGLIGGSIAKAFKSKTDYLVYGYDINPEIISKAIADKTIDGEAKIEECDIVIPCLYPSKVISFVFENKSRFKKGAIVIDMSGVKSKVCEKCEELASKNGFTFIGAHPMAGTEHSGFEYSKADMFENAPLIICKDTKNEKIEDVFSKIGFSDFRYVTPKEHDKKIAFTSQLAHVLSNAYVKSPEYPEHKGFSAGSLKDLTRVAWLNETMWTELFLENRENLAFEVDNLISNLEKYSKALKENDEVALCELLKEGRMLKEKVDGR